MEQKELTGVLFKNDKKTETKHPDAKGSCLIDGKEYWVAAWRKQSKDGAAYTSLSFTLKEAKPEAPPEINDTMASDLPF